MSRLDLSDQAKKILDRETQALEREAAVLEEKATSAASVLTAVCGLMNSRGRYFAVTGEHFSVQDYDGLMVIDFLDEQVLKHAYRILKNYVEHENRRPNEIGISIIAEKLLPSIKEMPKYPVGYRLLYTIRKAFEQFESVIGSGSGVDVAELEGAFVHHILGVIDKYVQTRVRHGVRHFSEVAREYDFVTRMKCKCGDGQFQVKLQALVQEEGKAYDRLDLECKACGHQRSITFDLPNFKDLYES